MVVKKDGNLYRDLEEAIHAYCLEIDDCTRCELFNKPGCITYAWTHPEEAARIMGFEMIEDTPDIREVVEKCGEDVKPDPVNRPTHYTSGGIECIDAMQAAFGVEAVKDFCLCNAFKYLWRHRNKNGVEDLKKCRWYLNRMIREMEVEDDDT